METSSLWWSNASVVRKCCSRPSRRKHHRCCRQTLPIPGSVVPGTCFRITMRTRLCFETPLKILATLFRQRKQVRNRLATEVREGPKTQDKAERLMVTFVVAFLHEPGAGAACFGVPSRTRCWCSLICYSIDHLHCWLQMLPLRGSVVPAKCSARNTFPEQCKVRRSYQQEIVRRMSCCQAARICSKGF